MQPKSYFRLILTKPWPNQFPSNFKEKRDVLGSQLRTCALHFNLERIFMAVLLLINKVYNGNIDRTSTEAIPARAAVINSINI